MEKAEIIKQWIEDQKEVNPEALGWLHYDDEGEYKRYSHNDWVLETNKTVNTIYKNHEFDSFTGKISNQGELRILMKMLNIN